MNFNVLVQELKKYGITKYTIFDNGKVHAHQDVNLRQKKLTVIPFCFYQIDGYFDCSLNQLTSLQGSPERINGSFDCSHNQLTSLEFCPQKVGGGFYCNNNQLSSLKHCPETINGEFDCHGNQLTSLEFCPQKISGAFHCYNNQLDSLRQSKIKPIWWFENPIQLEEIIELVKNDENFNWRGLIQVQDTSSKEIVLEQLQSKLEIIGLISQNDTI